MKALVLCGGIPQIAAIKELKSRGIKTVLADMNENVSARKYADEFFKVSVLDVEGVRKLVKEQNIDFIISVCADQVLQVAAQISEELGLPCYIDYDTAVNVSKKSYMKQVFFDNDIPTSKFVIMEDFEIEKIKNLSYPIIVKPVDAYSSRGVKKVSNQEELKNAFYNAKNISRTNSAIVEEFFEGDEVTVDIYVENGEPNILCLSNLYKIGEGGKFIINRSRIPADISDDIKTQIFETAKKIVKAFGLKNCPMLIQLISNGKKISVVEFCARTGGGIKFVMIKKNSGFDVVKSVIDLTLGNKPHVEEFEKPNTITINEFVYCNKGILDHIEGFEELIKDGIINEFNQFKLKSAEFGEINGSGDRVAFFSIVSDSEEDIKRRHKIANQRIKAISTDGKDLIRHDLISKYSG